MKENNIFFNRRGPIEIISHILTTIHISDEGFIQKTHIMYYSNLNWKQLEIYLNYLEKKRMIERKMHRGKEHYRITRCGVDALKLLNNVKELFIE